MSASKYYKVVVFQLYPTKDQDLLFRKTIGSCRFIYNHLLALRIENHNRYKDGKKDVPLPTEKELKQEYEWLKEPDSQALQQSRLDLNTAFTNCFKHKFGYPKFHKKGTKESFRCTQSVWIEENYLRIGKNKNVKARGAFNRVVGKVKSITVRLDAGKWYASVLQELTAEQFYTPKDFRYEACGIDLGVMKPVTLTDGNKFKILGVEERQRLIKAEQRRRKYTRRMSRRKLGSKNREKARRKVQHAFQRERFLRKDFIEKTSDKLTCSFQKIVFEDLKLANMTKKGGHKHGLNRELLRMGLGALVTRTQQKAFQRGCNVVFVNPMYTSQTCSECGCVSKLSRKSQSRFNCVECGFKLNADRNAALNILARAK